MPNPVNAFYLTISPAGLKNIDSFIALADSTKAPTAPAVSPAMLLMFICLYSFLCVYLYILNGHSVSENISSGASGNVSTER